MGNVSTEQLQELQKVLLVDGEGNGISPVSLASTVYDIETGKTAEDLIKELKNSSHVILSTKVQILEVTYDNQFIFKLDYPIENYDIEKFPVLIIKNDKEVNSSYYMINTNEPNGFDQLIFNTAKFEPFKKGETVIVIYHYADVIYQGSVINANLINNMNIIWESPEPGAEIPDKTVLFDFENSEIVYYINGQEYHFPIGEKKIVRSSLTITTTTQEVPIEIPGYNSTEDTLIVFENNVYIPEGEYYTIDENLIMKKINNIVWEATSYEPITFDFVVHKKATGVLASSVGNSSVSAVVPNGTVSKEKLSPELQTYLEEVEQAAQDLSDITNSNNINVNPIAEEGQTEVQNLQNVIAELYSRIRVMEEKVNNNVTP